MDFDDLSVNSYPISLVRIRLVFLRIIYTSHSSPTINGWCDIGSSMSAFLLGAKYLHLKIEVSVPIHASNYYLPLPYFIITLESSFGFETSAVYLRWRDFDMRDCELCNYEALLFTLILTTGGIKLRFKKFQSRPIKILHIPPKHATISLHHMPHTQTKYHNKPKQPMKLQTL